MDNWAVFVIHLSWIRLELDAQSSIDIEVRP